jgi:hypothetical protein
LTEVTIPNSVTSIGEDAFSDCSDCAWITRNIWEELFVFDWLLGLSEI